MNFIKILQHAQAVSVSVVINYSEDNLMHIVLNNFHQGGKYCAQIDSHQVELRREVKFTERNIYLFRLYTLTI